MSTPDTPRTPEPTTAPPRRRPTGLIVLCVLLGVAAVGCAVWAFSAQSDADDAEQQLAEQRAAQVEATPEPTAAPDASDDELQQQLDEVAAELGTVGESVDDVQEQIDAAKGRFDEAEAARDDAANPVDRARAELDAFKAKAELAGSCVRGTFDSVSSALESGGADAAVTQLQELAGDCRAAVASE